MSEKDSSKLKGIANTLNILSWKSLRDYYVSKKEIIKQIKESKAKKQVWDLCDGKRSQSEISEFLGKGISTIKEHIDFMIDNEVVFSKMIGNKKMLYSLEFIIDKIFNSINWSFEYE